MSRLATIIRWGVGAAGLSLFCVTASFAAEPPQVPRPASAKIADDASGQASGNAGRAGAQPIGQAQAQGQPARGNERQPNQPGGRVTANKPVAEDNHDKTIASMLALSNEEEIEMAKMAQSKSENKDVKEFAKMMIEDHNDVLAVLEKFGARRMLTGQQASGERSSNNGTARQGGFDFLSMKRQVAEQCLKSAQKCWDSKKPAEADMAYVGSQIVMHQQMIDCATVAREHASPELQREIDTGIATAESHKEHAEKLIKQLGHEEHSESAKK